MYKTEQMSQKSRIVLEKRMNGRLLTKVYFCYMHMRAIKFHETLNILCLSPLERFNKTVFYYDNNDITKSEKHKKASLWVS